MLINSVNFTGEWIYPFEKVSTSKRSFYGTNRDSTVDMMYQNFRSINYTEDNELNAQLLELPFKVRFYFHLGWSILIQGNLDHYHYPDFILDHEFFQVRIFLSHPIDFYQRKISGLTSEKNKLIKESCCAISK